MAVLSLRDVTLGYGGTPLMERINLQIERGERVALLGRNGVGKSTLLKLINGELMPEAGEVTRAPGLRTARLVQEVPPGRSGTIHDVVIAGARDLPPESSASWQIERQVERVISIAGLDPQQRFEAISSGTKRRVLLARALVGDPDLLLLDEPTNHLDLESITWLETFLGGFAGTLVFVTHDRVLMQKLATRIVELERARLFDWTCDYQTFLKRKEAVLEAEAQQQARFDKQLAQEEAWIRQGVKARRTRNEGRVRALEELRRQHRARRSEMGSVRMQAQEAERTGRLVIEAQGVSFGYQERPVIRDLTATLMRGDKVGILGPNGSGKTTLLRLLLGELAPQSGTIRHGTNLEIVYFDQLRAQINEDKTVQDNVSGGSEHVLIAGQRRHIIGYLQDFLFSPERARSPARFLSGGERNRLLLARLFTRPSNVIVLDEPTNDLDSETLELLESLLVEYRGTILLVSHDRAFLDHVATSVLAFEGDGLFKEYEGGYHDWLRQHREPAPAQAERTRAKAQPAREQPGRPRKLSYKETRELESLPQRIESLESEQQQLQERMMDASFFQQKGAKIAVARARLEEIQCELTELYGRWEALESIDGGSAASP
jgi:ATP-binding cassette subfamily F protein uup